MSITLVDFKALTPEEREEHLKTLKISYNGTVVSGPTETAKWQLYQQKVAFQDTWFKAQTNEAQKSFILATRTPRYPTFKF